MKYEESQQGNEPRVTSHNIEGNKMKKEKIVFIVSGSDDGVLGVYGNKKQAYNEALRYVEGSPYKIMSYSKVCKELKDLYNYGIDMIDDYRTEGNASIYAVLFNKNS